MARRAEKTLEDVVKAVVSVKTEVIGVRASVEVLTDKVGEIEARLDAQGELAAEVRRLADGQTALVNAVMQLVNIEGRVARIEAKVFPAPH